MTVEPAEIDRGPRSSVGWPVASLALALAASGCAWLGAAAEGLLFHAYGAGLVFFFLGVAAAVLFVVLAIACGVAGFAHGYRAASVIAMLVALTGPVGAGTHGFHVGERARQSKDHPAESAPPRG